MYINITNMIIEKFKYDNGFTCEDKPFKDEKGYYHYIYEIRFPNNKFYRGKHSTRDLYDGYGGSGKLLPFEYNKFSQNKVTKRIVKFCKNEVELSITEKNFIGNLHNTNECLNMIGGSICVNYNKPNPFEYKEEPKRTNFILKNYGLNGNDVEVDYEMYKLVNSIQIYY